MTSVPPAVKMLAAVVLITVGAAGGTRHAVVGLRRRLGPRLDGSAAATGGWLTRLIERRRRRAPGDDEVASWLDEAARRIRSGESLVAAVVTAGEAAAPNVRHALRPVVDGVARARSLTDVLGEVPARAPAPLALAVAVVRTTATMGGAAAAPLERAAATLRMRQAVRAEFATHSAQARLSARVMAGLPVAVLVLLSFVEPNIRRAIVTPAGIGCLVAGGAFAAVGALWMRRIVGSSA